MTSLSLRTRVTLWSALIVALGMLLCGAAIALVAYRAEIAELDGQLQAEARRFFGQWQQHGGPLKYDLRKNPHEVDEWLSASEPPRLIVLTDDGGNVIYHSKAILPEAVKLQPPGARDIVVNGEKWRFAGFREDGVRLSIIADLTPMRSLMTRIMLSFVMAQPVLLLFVALSGRWIASKALDPIREITVFAQNVSADQLHQRLPVPPCRDEIQALVLMLNSAFERLQTSFRQAQRFSADASHELKTPLTVLRTSIEALLDSPALGENDAAAVAGLLEQINRISSITEGLLLLARADAGKLQIDRQFVDLCQVVEDCCMDAHILAEPTNISIDTRMPEHAMVEGDKTRLMQIVSNLLSNAVKYNVPSGRISVSLTRDVNAWALDIANTGPGIAIEHQPHVFERFYRSEHSAHVGGYGLGLSLARELARAHGGTLGLISSDANLTIFRFRLPAAVGRPPRPAANRAPRATVIAQ